MVIVAKEDFPSGGFSVKLPVCRNCWERLRLTADTYGRVLDEHLLESGLGGIM